MSALHRLFAPDDTPSLAPLVRSRSPIAELDQRLALDDGAGLGLGLDEPDPLASPDAQPITPPIASADSVAAAPVVHRKLATAHLPASPSPASPSPASPSPASPSAATPSPASATKLEPVSAPQRPPKLDPGPLFDLALELPSFDETQLDQIRAQTPPAHEPQARALEARERPLEARERPLEARERPLEPLPTRAPQLEPHAPRIPLVTQARELPVLEPRPRPRSELSPTTGELSPTTGELSPTTGELPPQPRSRAAAHARPSPASTPTPTPTRSRPRDIESLSQIGPLSRHFTSNRARRLRYR